MLDMSCAMCHVRWLCPLSVLAPPSSLQSAPPRAPVPRSALRPDLHLRHEKVACQGRHLYRVISYCITILYCCTILMLYYTILSPSTECHNPKKEIVHLEESKVGTL